MIEIHTWILKCYKESVRLQIRNTCHVQTFMKYWLHEAHHANSLKLNGEALGQNSYRVQFLWEESKSFLCLMLMAK